MNAPSINSFSVVGPRFVAIHPDGKLEGDEAQLIMDAVEANVKGEPYFLLEVYMEKVDGVSPEARRLIAERLQILPNRAIALIGCNFTQRMLAKLVLTAVSMLSKNDTNAAGFFDDREGAREWLQEYAAKQDDGAAS